MRSNEGDRKAKKSLITLAKENLTLDNPSLLGDPVSLKAEAANSHPTEHDMGAAGVSPERKGDTFKEMPKGVKNGGGGGGVQDKEGQGQGNKKKRGEVVDTVRLGVGKMGGEDENSGKKGSKL